MKKAYWVVVFLLFTFCLIAVDSVIVNNYLQVLQESTYLWEHKPANSVLSDILFIEGALLLVAGAVFAGFSLYTMVMRPSDKLKYDDVKSVFDWETIKKEQAESSTMKIGLVLLAVGIVCIVVAVLVTL